MHRIVIIIDTEAGTDFVGENDPSTGFDAQISIKQLLNTSIATEDPLLMLGIIKLLVHFSNTAVTLRLAFSETLAASIINGADLCDQHVKAIHQKQGLVELDGGVPVVQKHRGQMKLQPSLLDGLTYPKNSS